MAKEYTIPELLGFAAIRGYSPRLGEALNTLVSTSSEVEYQNALEIATAETSGLYDYTEIGTFTDKSHFEGLPIYLPLILESIDGVKDDLLLESAIVSVGRTKNIVITDVQGRDTSVKEFINNGDWDISITGIICNNGVGYPLDQVREFQDYMTAKSSIKVVHEVLNMLGINEIVVTDQSMPSSPMVNVQRYSFNAISEKEIELRIEE